MGLTGRRCVTALWQSRFRWHAKLPTRDLSAHGVPLLLRWRRDRRVVPLRLLGVLVGLGLILLTVFFTLLMIGTVVDAATDDIADLWGLAIAIPGLVGVGGLWLVADRRIFARLPHGRYRP